MMVFNMDALPNICGFNKVSEIGDDVFVPAVFMGGCNFKCPYCMNSKLVNNPEPKVNIEEVEKFVKENGSKWVMISGGEPTCTPQDSLEELMKKIKSWGCKIGMSTNGSNYHILFNIINNLNYVALDLKSGNIGDYDKIGNENTYENVVKSRSLIALTKKNRKDFDYEIRTTLYPPFINADSLRKIGQLVNRNDHWLLQQFRHSKNMLDPNCINISPYSYEETQNFLAIASEYCDNVKLRYV